MHSTLVNLNQDVGQSVNEFLAVLQPIWTQLDQAKISKDHLHLIKVLMGLRPGYEFVRAALLHHNPLPSLDATIQEILFEEKHHGINSSKQSDVVLASAYSLNGTPNTFCKNCKLSGHKFSDCPKIECRYCHKRGYILDNIVPPNHLDLPVFLQNQGTLVNLVPPLLLLLLPQMIPPPPILI